MMKQNHSEELINESIKNIPLKRVCEPSEIANVALFLATIYQVILQAKHSKLMVVYNHE